LQKDLNFAILSSTIVIIEAFLSSALDIFDIILSSILDKKQRIEIEVGGKSKGRKQIIGLTDAFVFKDGIEIGHTNVIPLYLTGFLY
jgi:hypothetical protein